MSVIVHENGNINTSNDVKSFCFVLFYFIFFQFSGARSVLREHVIIVSCCFGADSLYCTLKRGRIFASDALNGAKGWATFKILYGWKWKYELQPQGTRIQDSPSKQLYLLIFDDDYNFLFITTDVYCGDWNQRKWLDRCFEWRCSCGFCDESQLVKWLGAILTNGKFYDLKTHHEMIWNFVLKPKFCGANLNQMPTAIVHGYAANFWRRMSFRWCLVSIFLLFFLHAINGTFPLYSPVCRNEIKLHATKKKEKNKNTRLAPFPKVNATQWIWMWKFQ